MVIATDEPDIALWDEVAVLEDDATEDGMPPEVPDDFWAGWHDGLPDEAFQPDALRSARVGQAERLEKAKRAPTEIEFLNRRLVSPEFRQQFVLAFPQAAQRPPLMRLALYLLGATWVDEASGTVVAPASLLAGMAERVPQFVQRNFVAQELLDEFQAAVCPLNVSEHCYTTGEARTLTARWPSGSGIEAAWAEEARHPFKGRAREAAVSFVKGQPYRQRSQDQGVKRVAAEVAETAGDHPGQALLELLNGQKATVFRRLVDRNLEGAQDEIQRIVKRKEDGTVDEARTRRARAWSLNILHEVCSNPMPMYEPSPQGRTVRLFPVGASYLRLPRAVRKALLAGTWEFDLANAQLAIAAREWQIPDIQCFLRTGRSVWAELAVALGREVDEVKPTLKPALYSILFGAGRKRLRALLVKGEAAGEGLGQQGATRFFRHPLIQALWEARQRRFEELQAAGTATTVFGKVIPVTTHEEARSALAQCAQAVELQVLGPVEHLVRDSSDMVLVAWQHDGFTLHFTNQSKAKQLARRVTKAVSAEIEQLGLLTRLEVVQL